MNFNITLNGRAVITTAILLILGAGSLRLAHSQGSDGSAGAPDAGPGTAFTYQGRIELDGAPADGQFTFRFTLESAATGDAPVGAPVEAPEAVTNGAFTAALDFGVSAFNGSPRWLKVEVEAPGANTFTTLDDRPELRATPYAQYASHAPWSGLIGVPDGVGSGVPWAQVIIVAKSGGDFSTIQGAINSITDASYLSRYLVWVAPGTYAEHVVLKPYVDLEGAGSHLTIVSGSDGATRAAAAAITISQTNSNLRKIGISSNGTGASAVGLLVDSSGYVNIEDIDVNVIGGVESIGVAVTNSNYVYLRSSTILAIATQAGYGILVAPGQQSTITDTVALGSGALGIGIDLEDSQFVTVAGGQARGTGTTAKGMVLNGGDAVVRGVAIEGSGDTAAYGIESSGAGSPRVYDSYVDTVAQGTSVGYHHLAGSTPTIDGTTIYAREGSTRRAVANSPGDTTAATVSIKNSTIIGATNGVGAFTPGITYNVATTQLDGPKGAIGNYHCVDSYNGAFAPLGTTC